ncbi:MAG: CDP-alcohol phosphatidyltransferase [Frankiales bacterium]|nr:CDP-alcohol phosphatidyltransferase [Frankiales bacterium]
MVRSGPVIGLAAQLLLLSALAGSIGLSLTGWLVGAACGLITNLLLNRGLIRSAARALGPANRVTLTRATLAGGTAALIADRVSRPGPVHTVSVTTMVLLATIALALDAVDGSVARRTGTASELGARFDMETDAFLIFALSVYVARSLGPWVLVIGAARYAFVAAGWLLPWLRRSLPARYWRKPVTAIQGIVLTIAVADVLPVPIMDVALAIALGLLTESFGRDVWWLGRRRVSVTKRANQRPVALLAPTHERALAGLSARVDRSG